MSFNGDQYPNTAAKVITTRGDIIRGNSSGERARYGIGAANTVLTSDGSDPAWAAAALAPTTTKGDISGFSTTQARIPISTNDYSLFADSAEALGLKWAASPTSTLDATGSMLYASGANTLAKLAAGTQYYNLQQGASVPAWAASSASTLTTTGDLLAASAANTLTRIAGGASGEILTGNGAGVLPTFQASAGGGKVEFLGATDTIRTVSPLFGDNDMILEFDSVNMSDVSEIIAYAYANPSTNSMAMTWNNNAADFLFNGNVIYGAGTQEFFGSASHATWQFGHWRVGSDYQSIIIRISYNPADDTCFATSYDVGETGVSWSGCNAYNETGNAIDSIGLLEDGKDLPAGQISAYKVTR